MTLYDLENGFMVTQIKSMSQQYIYAKTLYDLENKVKVTTI